MSTALMKDHAVPLQEFPLTLYRIDYPGSQTSYSERRGFKAATNLKPRNIDDLRLLVKSHLNWSNRTQASPFISTFSDGQHAENWGNRRVRRGTGEPGTCYIVEIKIEADDDIIVFRVADLVARLDIEIPHLSPSQYRSEYFCFRRIPSRVITSRRALSPVEGHPTLVEDLFVTFAKMKVTNDDSKDSEEE